MEGAAVIITAIVILMALILSYWSRIKEWFANDVAHRQKTEIGDIVDVLLADLKTLRDEGRTMLNSLPPNKQERLRQVLHISENQWRQTCKTVPIDDIIGKLDSDISVITPNKTSATPEPSKISELETQKDQSGSAPNETSATPEPSKISELKTQKDQSGRAPNKTSATPEPSKISELETQKDQSGRAPNKTSVTPKPSKVSELERKNNQSGSTPNKTSMPTKPSTISELQAQKKSSEKQKAHQLFEQLGLTGYHPSKISLQDVMAVGGKSEAKDDNLSNLPWCILRKLIMSDFNGRDKPTEFQNTASKDGADKRSTFDEIFGDSSNEMSLNALDVFLALYACCDLGLKQTLVQKMFMCRLAVPFITPTMSNDTLSFSLWAFRSIIVEWKNNEQICSDTSVVCQPVHTVSFLKVGKPSISKSVLLNKVISEQHHHTFWNKECPNAGSDYTFANGLVEAQWYLPSGMATDRFKDVTMFLNLRGDACEKQLQVAVLTNISNVQVCCLEVTDLENDNVLQTLTEIQKECSRLVLLLAAKDPGTVDMQLLKRQIEPYQRTGKEDVRIIAGFKRGNTRKTEDLQDDLRNSIQDLLSKPTQNKKSIEEVSSIAKVVGIAIDEDDVLCQTAKACADKVFSFLKTKSPNKCKEEMMSLQGNWRDWSKLQTDMHRSIGTDPESNLTDENARIEKQMTKLRQKQLDACKNMKPVMKIFMEGLSNMIHSSAATLFIQYLKLSLDKLSRDTLPGLLRKYHQKWIEFSKSKSNPSSGQNTMLRDELASTEKTLADASMGVEHLMREVAQIYEAGHGSKELSQSTRETIKHLPDIGAKLLLTGQPIEIMDGDAANVPLTWVQAVFSSLKKEVGDKKLFVVSVLGIQSSGKSTLLNTMFGLQFAVSAGRCTRGVFMQLLKVDEKKKGLPYDYILVVDTEGLRAPELGQLKHVNDNQLATFVIGLGDVTVLNIKGENVAEVSDVLQIAVHAFLRMKLTNQTNRQCIFVHQNVSAINAKEKMKYGCQKLQESLDEITAEACTAENIVHISTFNDVIEFDSEKNVWYISDLWLGDPPMAPVNPGYTKKVLEVKQYLLHDLSQQQETFLTFSDMKDRVEDLWKAVLSENFVFSFRNSLAAKAYNSLERKYQEKSWMVQNGISEWVKQTAYVQLHKCQTPDKLEVCCANLMVELETKGVNLREKACSDLKDFFEGHDQKEIIIQWKAQKVEGLNNHAQLSLNRAERDINQKKDSLRIDLLKETRKEQHHIEIMNKAKQLAHEMKGHTVDEGELIDKFDQVWLEWLNEFAARTTTATGSVLIELKVEKILLNCLTQYNSALTKELRENPSSRKIYYNKLEGSIQCADITDTHLSIHYPWYTKAYKGATNYVLNKPKLQKQCAIEAAIEINSILKGVDVDLEDIQKQDVGFHESYAINVIKNVMDAIDDRNTKFKERFTFKNDLIAKIIVHVCCYAVLVFKRMQSNYDENHSVTKKIEKYKEITWALFKNIVKQSSIEVTAAAVLSKHLKVLVNDEVKKRMTSKIVNEIVEHFSFQKHSLLVRILGDLSDGDFKEHRSFLSNTKAFVQNWITTFTNKEIFMITGSGNSKYINFASSIISDLSQCISRSLEHATSVATKEKPPNIKTWRKAFCKELELPIKEDDLKHVWEENVQDFDHFKKLLMDQLQSMKENLLIALNAESPAKIKWEGETPYKLILATLWGCEAQCPFCGEVCQRSDPNHLSPNDCHQCIQHRPGGVLGRAWEKGHERSEQLTLATCNYKVQSNIFYIEDDQNHPYKEYKNYEPDWDIAPSPNMESSKYWLWFMAKYKQQLADWYSRKVPEIPTAWDLIKKQEALDSLRVHYG